jgi:hypothetical protein
VLGMIMGQPTNSILRYPESFEIYWMLGPDLKIHCAWKAGADSLFLMGSGCPVGKALISIAPQDLWMRWRAVSNVIMLIAYMSCGIFNIFN